MARTGSTGYAFNRTRQAPLATRLKVAGSHWSRFRGLMCTSATQFRAGDIAPQVAEVSGVKRKQHGVILDPHSIGEDRRVADALALMKRTGVGTLAVVDHAQRLKGLLTERDVRFVKGDATVAERMTPRSALIVHTGTITLADAEAVMTTKKIKKLKKRKARGPATASARG